MHWGILIYIERCYAIGVLAAIPVGVLLSLSVVLFGLTLPVNTAFLAGRKKRLV